jgi:hypothetical protein
MGTASGKHKDEQGEQGEEGDGRAQWVSRGQGEEVTHPTSRGHPGYRRDSKKKTLEGRNPCEGDNGHCQTGVLKHIQGGEGASQCEKDGKDDCGEREFPTRFGALRKGADKGGTQPDDEGDNTPTVLRVMAPGIEQIGRGNGRIGNGRRQD